MENKQMKKERRRKTRIHDELMKTVSDNILSAIGDKTYDDIAEHVGVTKASVKSWVGKKYLPSVEQLTLLSQVLNRDPGWFLKDQTFEGSKTAEITYAEAYQILRPLSMMGLINTDSIPDYFLNYLLKRSQELDRRQNIPQEKLDSWYRSIIAKFSVPVMPRLENDMYKMLEDTYGDIVEEDTVVAVLQAVRDYHAGIKKDEYNKQYLKWKARQDPTTPLILMGDDGELTQYSESLPYK